MAQRAITLYCRISCILFYGHIAFVVLRNSCIAHGTPMLHLFRSRIGSFAFASFAIRRCSLSDHAIYTLLQTSDNNVVVVVVIIGDNDVPAYRASVRTANDELYIQLLVCKLSIIEFTAASVVLCVLGALCGRTATSNDENGSFV